MLDYKEWALQKKEQLTAKMRFAAEEAEKVDFIPYTTKNGKWEKSDINWWTNGFWGAAMWQMYFMSGDAFFRNAAVRGEEMMDAALVNYERLDHDVGFLWLIQSGVRYAQEHNEQSLKRALLCANILAGRYNPNGFIRAWNQTERAGWAIIDTMMNLPLLYWASRQTQDPRYKLIAVSHADTAIKAFIRPDGSSNHIVCFDPENGAFLENPGGQGYESGSSWSRGQAWALYGFALSYKLAGKREYLDTALKAAHYFMANIREDGLVLSDFRAPKQPEVFDDAAAAIAASGLIEISRLVPEYQKEIYLSAALKLLKALDEKHADFSLNTPAILTSCTAAYNDVQSRGMTMIYADYFFIECVSKLLGSDKLFWAPDIKNI